MNLTFFPTTIVLTIAATALAGSLGLVAMGQEPPAPENPHTPGSIPASTSGLPLPAAEPQVEGAPADRGDEVQTPRTIGKSDYPLYEAIASPRQGGSTSQTFYFYGGTEEEARRAAGDNRIRSIRRVDDSERQKMIGNFRSEPHSAPLADKPGSASENDVDRMEFVLSGFNRSRDEAAHAIFKLGECYRSLNRIEEAKVQYARILREFVDFPDLLRPSQKILAELGKRAASARGGQGMQGTASVPSEDAGAGLVAEPVNPEAARRSSGPPPHVTIFSATPLIQAAKP